MISQHNKDNTNKIYKTNNINKIINSNNSSIKPCKHNEILRKGYTRKSYTRKNGINVRHSTVKPGCITKRNKSYISLHKKNKSNNHIKSNIYKKRIFLNNDDHFLSEHGYFDIEHKTKEERLEALRKLITHIIPIKGEKATYQYIIKALNTRYILNHNTHPKAAHIFKSDQRTISSIYKKKLQLHKK